MNRNLVLIIVVAAALGALGWFVFGRNKHSSSTSETRGSATASSTNVVPRSNGRAPGIDRATSGSGASAAAADPSQPVTPFQRARSRAMANLQNEITQRIGACAPPSAAPPRPRPLRIILEHRPEASSGEKQQYLVKDVTLLVANADDVTPAVRACIDQVRGMPVVLFVNPDAIASEDRTMDETFEIPLPGS